MERSEQAQAFLESLDQDDLKVGDGSDGLPVWIGIDPEAGKVYKVYASGLGLGFGDGDMVSRVGIGPRAGAPVDQTIFGCHAMLSHGEGMDRKTAFLEVKSQKLPEGRGCLKAWDESIKAYEDRLRAK